MDNTISNEEFERFAKFCEEHGIKVLRKEEFSPTKPLSSTQPRKIRLLDVTMLSVKKLYASIWARHALHKLNNIQDKIDAASEGSQISDYVKLQKSEQKLKELEQKIERLPISDRMSSRLNIRMIKLKHNMFETMRDIGEKFGIKTPEIDHNDIPDPTPAPAPVVEADNENNNDDNLGQQLDDHLQSLQGPQEPIAPEPNVSPSPIPFNMYHLKQEEIIQDKPALPPHEEPISLANSVISENSLGPVQDKNTLEAPEYGSPSVESAPDLVSPISKDIDIKQNIGIDNNDPMPMHEDIDINQMMDPKEIREKGHAMDDRLRRLRERDIPEEFVSGDDTIKTLLARKQELEEQRALALKAAEEARLANERAKQAEEAAKVAYQQRKEELERRLRNEIDHIQKDVLVVSNNAFQTTSETKQIEERTADIQRAMEAFNYNPISSESTMGLQHENSDIKARK